MERGPRMISTRTRNSLVVAVLAVIATGSWWLTRDRGAATPREALRRVPSGYYLKDAVLLGTDEAGGIYYRVHAGRIEQPERDRPLEFEDIRVEYRGEESRWQISAANAVASPDRSRFELSGNIRLSQRSEDDRRVAVIETEQMQFTPGDYLMATDQAVRIKIGGGELNVVGLTADLKSDRLELESEVHGEFLP